MEMPPCASSRLAKRVTWGKATGAVVQRELVSSDVSSVVDEAARAPPRGEDDDMAAGAAAGTLGGLGAAS